MLRILSGGRHLLMFARDGGLWGGSDGCGMADWATFSDAPYVEDPDPWTDDPEQRIRMKPDIENSECRWQGWGASSVELSDGRVVTVVSDNEADYNNGLPFVVYSDNGGVTWLPNDYLPVRVAVGGGIVPVMRDDYPTWSDTSLAIDRQKCAPAIAVDPNSDDVYVAFYARAERNDNTQSDRNSDIYIVKARHPDEDITFPGDESAYLVQLTDEMLGLEAGETGPDQVMPSIAIDPCGGVNVVFYDTRDPDSEGGGVVDVYFVRITDFGTENMSIQQERLTNDSFLLPTGGNDFLGDYHHMALAATRPILYPAWIGIGQNGGQNAYVNKISILCSTELLAYSRGEVDTCSLFEQLVEDRTIDGDLNGDEVVDYEDEAIFAALIEGMRE